MKMATKRERGPNFIEVEKNLLINLVSEKISIIENKKTDHRNLKMKEEAWNEIAVDFNSNALAATKRTSEQLKNFYDNYKRKTKKAAASDKVELYKTGGGTFKKKLDEEGERLMAMMEPQFHPMANPGDSDNGYHEKEIQIEYVPVFDNGTTTDEIQEIELLSDGSVIAAKEYEVNEGSMHSTATAESYPKIINADNDCRKRKRTQAADSAASKKKKINKENPRKEKNLETYVDGKVNINELKIQMMREKHQLEMRILQKALELKEIECEIKKKELENMSK